MRFDTDRWNVIYTDGYVEIAKSPLGILVMQCKKCKQEVHEVWNFCPYCGAKLKETANER